MKNRKDEKLTAITLAVFRLNGLLIEWGDQLCRPHGLSSARWQVLGAISLARHAQSAPQIAAAMGMSRQGVQKQINLLLEDGLVKALGNAANKRSPVYELTAHGEQIYQTLQQSWQAHTKRLSGQFTGAELNTALQVLSGLENSHADPINSGQEAA